MFSLLTKYKKRILIVSVLLVLIAVAVGPRFYREWQMRAEIRRLNAEAEKKRQQNEVLVAVIKEQLAKMTPEQLRTYLVTSYKMKMDQVNPQLNNIQVFVSDPIDGKYKLFARHSFFGKYSFDVGPLQKYVQNWMDENQNELKRADVARVGVQEDLFGGGAYLYVK